MRRKHHIAVVVFFVVLFFLIPSNISLWKFGGFKSLMIRIAWQPVFLQGPWGTSTR